MDANGIIAAAYDVDANQLRVTEVSGTPESVAESRGHKLDFQGTLIKVFDPSTNSLRVIVV